MPVKILVIIVILFSKKEITNKYTGHMHAEETAEFPNSTPGCAEASPGAQRVNHSKTTETRPHRNHSTTLAAQ